MLDGTLVPRLRRSGWEESLYCGRWQARNGGDANWQRSGASHRPTRQRPIRSFRCDRTPPRSAASSQPGPGSGWPSPLSAGIRSHSCPCRQLTLINASLGSGAAGEASAHPWTLRPAGRGPPAEVSEGSVWQPSTLETQPPRAVQRAARRTWTSVPVLEVPGMTIPVCDRTVPNCPG